MLHQGRPSPESDLAQRWPARRRLTWEPEGVDLDFLCYIRNLNRKPSKYSEWLQCYSWNLQAGF